MTGKFKVGKRFAPITGELGSEGTSQPCGQRGNDTLDHKKSTEHSLSTCGPGSTLAFPPHPPLRRTPGG